MDGLLLPFAFFTAAHALGTDHSQQTNGGKWLHGAMAGQSVPVLGSDETRRGFGFFIEYERREPKFRFPKGVGDLVWEGYYLNTFGGPDGGDVKNRLSSIGFLAMARWRWPQSQRNLSFFTDLGWGFVYGDRTTADLDSNFNSTPVLDFGAAIGPRSRETLIGIRLLHMSDAGLKGKNQGQNQLHLFLAKRY